MALQTLTEAARNGTLMDSLTQYLEYCRCPDGTDTQPTPGTKRRPRRLFPNLAGFCFWMECGFSAFRELQATFPDEADLILCAMEDQALNAYYLKVRILMAYLRNRLGYDPPKRKSAHRGRAKDRDRPCKIEVYSAAQYEALFGNADHPAAQDSEPSTEHVPEPSNEPTPDPSPASPPEQVPRPSPPERIARITTPPPYSVYRIRHTAKRSTFHRSRPPPLTAPVVFATKIADHLILDKAFSTPHKK